jgi:erythromycin esterase
MTRLIIFLLILQSFAYSQSGLKFTPLTSYTPEIETTDLSKIDSVFNYTRLIGIGECTHGTSEFTTMRHRMFKYLVDHKGFNTVFIEADFSACQRLNRYVNGETDNIDKVIFELLYFAWTTDEMKKFVEWIRYYNLKSTDKIQIVGCDMQSISDDKIEINRMKEKSNQIDSIPKFFSTFTLPYEDTNSIKSALSEWSLFYKNQLLHNLDSNNFKLMNSTITQFLNYKLNKYQQYNYRDSCMAINILEYLNLNPNSKGILMAHNGHVSKTIYDYTYQYSYKTAGQFLNEYLGEKYISIAQTTNTGNFNAWNYLKSKPVFSICELKKAKRNSLENKLSKLEVDILVCKYSSIESINKLTYTEIGHTYGKTNMNYKIKRYKKLKEGKFDYVIYFKNTNESSILKR